MQSLTPIPMKPIIAATEIAEAVCALPAIATFEWCDRAAACLSRLLAPSLQCVAILTIDAAGAIVAHEAIGVGSTQAANSMSGNRPPAEGQPEAHDLDPRLPTLQRRLERLAGIGWHPDDLHLAKGVVAPIGQLIRGGDWRTGSLGRQWTGLDVADVLVGLIPLDEADPGRVLFVQIAPTTPGAAVTDDEAAVLRAVLPLFRRKALMAFGSGRTNEGQWLTAREQLILEELALGKSVKQIADDIGRSPHTVHDHVKSLHRKLNASSRGELIARALGHLPQGARIRDRYRSAQSGGVETVTTLQAQKQQPAA